MKCTKSGFLLIIGWGKSGKAFLNDTVFIYSVNSFSSLIACYLVRLDKQFFGRCWNIFRPYMALCLPY